MPLDDLHDGELIGRVAAGDVEAFAVLFRRRQGQVYRFALHMTASPAVAEDVTQDVFLAVMGDAGRYDATRASVVAWLCGIARNHVRRRAERDRPLQPLGDSQNEADAEADKLFADADDVLGALTRAESIEAVRDAVLTLPIVYREAIVLCDLQEMSYADAAAALGCAVGTVRSRLHRGRALLATKLSASAGVERENNRSRKPSSTPAITRVPNRTMQSVRTVG